MTAPLPPLRLPPTSCANCAYREPCGGLDGNGDLFGCFSCVGGERCAPDVPCPTCNWERFIELSVEIEWFGFDSKIPLEPFTAALPSYIPKQHHAYSRGRPLAVPWVAVSLGSLFKVDRQRRHLRPRFKNVRRLREGLRIGGDTEVLVCPVTHDVELERFWEFHRLDDAPGKLKAMGVIGTMTPNFSFYRNAPRPVTLRNRKRILLTAERLAAAHVPTILHLNAQTRADWNEWERVLRDQPRMSVVCKEFQTGLKDADAGRLAWDRLSELEQKLVRPLHVVAVGAAQFLTYAARRVSGITLVDSDPFIKTQKRFKCHIDRSGELAWRKHETKKGVPLDDLLEANVRTYTAWVERTLQKARPSNGDPRQLDLPMLLRAG